MKIVLNAYNGFGGHQLPVKLVFERYQLPEIFSNVEL